MAGHDRDAEVAAVSRIEPLGHEPPPRKFDANVQMIASAGFLRGVVLTRGDTIAGSVEARDLCRALRAAHEATRGDPHAHAHVERLAFGITLNLGVKGAVPVSRSAMNLIEGYARRTKREVAAPSRPLPSEAGEVSRHTGRRGRKATSLGPMTPPSRVTATPPRLRQGGRA